MKLLLLMIGTVLLAQDLSAQNPVSWKFSAKKINATSYEVQLKAKIDAPWHIYSQSTPEGGPVPTKISFTKNPLLTLEGTTKESGKLVQKHEEVFGVDVKYFDGSVEFMQVVKVRQPNVKTTISGSVEYMVCNDTQCLPPTQVPFTVSLE